MLLPYPSTATEADVFTLVELDEACFAAGERWTPGMWSDEIASPTTTVLLLGEDDAPTSAAASFTQVAEVADLNRVMVHPQVRGRGLARALIREGAAWAEEHGAERMLLEVRHDNQTAIGLYRQLGFETIDTRPNYYGAGLDAIVMQAPLPLPVDEEDDHE